MDIEIHGTASGAVREYCVFVTSHDKTEDEAAVIRSVGRSLGSEPIGVEARHLDIRFQAQLPAGLTWEQLEEALFKSLVKHFGEPVQDVILVQPFTYSDQQLINNIREVLEDMQERARVGKMVLPADIGVKIEKLLPELETLLAVTKH